MDDAYYMDLALREVECLALRRCGGKHQTAA